MKPFDFQLIKWKYIPKHRHPLLSAYEARRLVREPSCLCNYNHDPSLGDTLNSI